jgi:cysteinyl-tRNA synthetase
LKIYLANTLTNKKEEFIPFNKDDVKMYVCGPTVYDRPHIGNARSSVIFDMLYRLLKVAYLKVTYVRNITDVDDKIIAASNENSEDVKELTCRMTSYFHQDLEALNCLPPDHEPRATENIENMILMIERLIAKGHAYANEGSVYFDIKSFPDYGKLSNKKIEDLQVGNRVEVSDLKKNPLDFILWKPRKSHEQLYFDSPWGEGRPGWHIECSAMSKDLLGDRFDIHGGGSDLVFPHHENEIAQSRCESSTNHFAKYWLHNGFLTVSKSKMSKSLKNFITVKDLSSKGVDGAIIRYFYLTAHYKKPLDFNQKALDDSTNAIEKFKTSLKFAKTKMDFKESKVPSEFLTYLADDLNSPAALRYLHNLSSQILNGDAEKANDLYSCCQLLGLNIEKKEKAVDDRITVLAEKRKEAKKSGNWVKADRIRDEIESLGCKIIDTKDGYEIT